MNERTKKIITGGVVAVLVGLAIFGIATLARQRANEQVDSREIQEAVDQNGDIGDHVKGNMASSVILVKYGDFQCPACAPASVRVQDLMEEYGDRVALIFRNFPLQGMQNSRAAAAAAEAAGLQGKYWEMHSLIFSKQREWSGSSVQRREEQFRSYAEELGLNIDQFNADFASNRVVRKINFDARLGSQDGVSGTPFFVLNGRVLSSQEWGNDSRLRQILDEEIANVGGVNNNNNDDNNSASDDADQD